MTDIEMLLGVSLIDMMLVLCLFCAGAGMLCGFLFLALLAWKQIKGEGDVNVRSE